MASKVPHASAGINQFVDGSSYINWVSRYAASSKVSGFEFPRDPFRWQDIDTGNVVVHKPIIRSYSDKHVCDHCGADVPCKCVGPDNGEKYWLCEPCAKMKMAHERARFGLSRRIGR